MTSTYPLWVTKALAVPLPGSATEKATLKYQCTSLGGDWSAQRPVQHQVARTGQSRVVPIRFRTLFRSETNWHRAFFPESVFGEPLGAKQVNTGAFCFLEPGGSGLTLKNAQYGGGV